MRARGPANGATSRRAPPGHRNRPARCGSRRAARASDARTVFYCAGRGPAAKGWHAARRRSGGRTLRHRSQRRLGPGRQRRRARGDRARAARGRPALAAARVDAARAPAAHGRARAVAEARASRAAWWWPPAATARSTRWRRPRWRSGCPFGVLPQGTFNYFGRTHGIPPDTGEADAAAARARPQPVQVGLVNDRVFLVNASLGLYPQLLEDREACKQQLRPQPAGGPRAPALVTLLRGHRQLRLRIEQRRRGARSVRTPTLFVGNNRAAAGADRHRRRPRRWTTGELARSRCARSARWRMLWLLLRGALGRLGEAERGRRASRFAQLTVRPAAPRRAAREGGDRRRGAVDARAAAVPRRARAAVAAEAARRRRTARRAHDAAAAGLRPALRHRAAPVVEALLRLAQRSAPDAGACCRATSRSARARASSPRRAPSSSGSARRALLAIPGNHDIPLFNLAARAAARPTRATARAFGAELEPECDRRRLLRAGAEHHAAAGATRTARCRRRRSSAWRARLRAAHAGAAAHRGRAPAGGGAARRGRARTCCTATRRRCGAGPRPAPTWCSAATSTCPTCCRCTRAAAACRAAVGGAGRHGGVLARAARGRQFGEPDPHAAGAGRAHAARLHGRALGLRRVGARVRARCARRTAARRAARRRGPDRRPGRERPPVLSFRRRLHPWPPAACSP